MISVLECLPRDLADGAGELDAGGARADDHEPKPRTSLGGLRDPLGHFERVQDLVADVRGLFDALHARRPLPPDVVPVVRGL
jgi:hypothetical protein